MTQTKQKENIAFVTKCVMALAAGLIMALFLGTIRAEAATKLALFNFCTASDLKVVKGAKLDLAGNLEADAWLSSNPKVVKVTKQGIATAVKPGTAVVSAKVDGELEECRITVVKNVLKGSKYIKNVYRTWEMPDGGKKVSIKSGSFTKGLNELLSYTEAENEGDVVYKKCTKIIAIEEDSVGATVYFEAEGIFHGKETDYPCVMVITNDYEHPDYEYMTVLQTVTWVADDGLMLYGKGSYWYA